MCENVSINLSPWFSPACLLDMSIVRPFSLRIFNNSENRGYTINIISCPTCSAPNSWLFMSRLETLWVQEIFWPDSRKTNFWRACSILTGSVPESVAMWLQKLNSNPCGCVLQLDLELTTELHTHIDVMKNQVYELHLANLNWILNWFWNRSNWILKFFTAQL